MFSAVSSAEYRQSYSCWQKHALWIASILPSPARGRQGACAGSGKSRFLVRWLIRSDC